MQPTNSKRSWSMLPGGVLLLAMFIAATGCAPRYNVVLTNGHVITSRGKPKFDKATGAYNFTDGQGKPASIPGFKVKEIAPPGMEEKDAFGPAKVYKP